MRRRRALLLAIAIAAAATAGPARAVSPAATEGGRGMVVSAQRLAAEAGRDILRAGGNAVDAAVATAFAEAVVNPCCGNLGGGGFMLIHLADGRDRFVNFRETAPLAASAGMYLGPDGAPVPRASLDGWRAVAVPGTVLGLASALERYGTMPLARVLAPARALAAEGFILVRGDTDILEAGARRMRADPAASRIFLHPDGTPLRPGVRLVQPDLAATLAILAENGPASFYRGPIGQALVRASREGGGLLSDADLAAYTVTDTEPLRCAYRGAIILSAPPPSSGGTTHCEIQAHTRGNDLRASGFNAAATVHVLVEAMRRAFLDRNTYLGDPAFVPNPVDRLLSPGHAARLRAAIDPGAATPSAALRPSLAGEANERPETTHISVADAAGNAVALTTTINGYFGAGVIAGETGFFLNNEMDDFTTAPGRPNLFGLVQGSANAIAPGKRPLSSMAPTILMQDGRLRMVLGSPGGSRIITIVAQVVMNVLDHGMAPQQAVDAPRIHHQWLPDVIAAEPFALSADTEALLRRMGHRIVEQTPWGAAGLIAWAPPGPASPSAPASSGNDASRTQPMLPGLTYGANDPRRPAGAALAE